jgi:glycine cleavage system H protein
MSVPNDLRYSKSHEWVRVDGDSVTVGITDFAQQQLSDLTFVELPAIGDVLGLEDEAAVVESVKAASDVYAPVSGTVIEVNQALDEAPELVNSDPYGEGWLFRLAVGNASEIESLLAPEEYEKLAHGDA